MGSYFCNLTQYFVPLHFKFACYFLRYPRIF